MAKTRNIFRLYFSTRASVYKYKPIHIFIVNFMGLVPNKFNFILILFLLQDSRIKFRVGDRVEVEGHEEGFQGSYFSDMVIQISKGNVITKSNPKVFMKMRIQSKS